MVRANLLALNFNNSDIFNVGTGRETSVNELTRLILQIAKSDIAAQTSSKNEFEQRRSSLDNRKIKESLNWSPDTSLKKGLSETFNYFKNDGI